MGAFSQKELEYLREQVLGRLATVSRKQTPQLTPIGFAADEERIFSSIRRDSVKTRNIRRNPKVSFVVDDAPSWGVHRGVSVSGKAELISSGKLHENGRDLLYEKYPRYEEDFPIREEDLSKYVLAITPIKVRIWGL